MIDWCELRARQDAWELDCIFTGTLGLPVRLGDAECCAAPSALSTTRGFRR